MTKFRIIVAGRNNAEYWRPCIESVQHQEYPRDSFHVDFVDDDSTDGSTWEIHDWADSNAREWNVDVHLNKTRRGAMANYYGLLNDPWWDDEVVVMVGSDDQFLNENVLKTLDKHYQDPNIWMTYGNYKTTDGSDTHANPYESDEFRREPFNFLHPCTFRSQLFRKLRREDLSMGSQWVPSSEDVAILTPMMEMSGLDRIRRLEDVMYLYRIHPGNAWTSEKLVQDMCHWYIRHQDPFERLLTLDSKATRIPKRYRAGAGLFCVPPNLDGLQARWRTSLAIPTSVDDEGNPHAHFTRPEK